MRVAVIAFDNCQASGVYGAIDLLHGANLVNGQRAPGAPPLFVTDLLTVDGQPVRAANSRRIVPDGAIASGMTNAMNGSRPDVIMLPGISLIESGPLLAEVGRLATGPLGRWLGACHAAGSMLAAACSAAFVLAEAGLLDGQAATTTTWYASLFERRYPRVKLDAGKVLAESGRIVTSGGAFSWLDLALRVVERSAGREIAGLLARYMVLDNRREPRSVDLIPHHVEHHDPLVLKAEKWMRTHLRADIGVGDIARHVAVSPRTLARRFRLHTGESPAACLQRLRIEAACGLLAGTRQRVESIPARIGYQDESTFRRSFKKHVGLSPREYRQRFAAG